MRFYAAKVVKPDGRRSKLITLFADNDKDAKQKVSESPLGHGADIIHVADLNPDAQGKFDRWLDDNNGVAEHNDYSFSDNGPINVFTLFGAQKKDT
jgi:hypothetical protein